MGTFQFKQTLAKCAIISSRSSMALIRDSRLIVSILNLKYLLNQVKFTNKYRNPEICKAIDKNNVKLNILMDTNFLRMV